MEAVYTDKYINICYHKRSDTLSGVWSNCDNLTHYNHTLDSFSRYFNEIKPTNTLWNKQGLNLALCEELQNGGNNFLDDNALKRNFTGKIAVILSEDFYQKTKLSNLQTELNSNLRLRYFKHEEAALEWFQNSLYMKEANLIKQLSIKEAPDDKYNISLTVSKNEFYECVSVLNHLIKNRDFCLKNADNFNSLTCREREILQYVIKGFKNCDIADYLYLSVETIKTHRKRLLAKLNCTNTNSLSPYLMFFNV